MRRLKRKQRQLKWDERSNIYRIFTIVLYSNVLKINIKITQFMKYIKINTRFVFLFIS